MLTVVGSSHDPKKLGPENSHDHFASGGVSSQTEISHLRVFANYPMHP